MKWLFVLRSPSRSRTSIFLFQFKRVAKVTITLGIILGIFSFSACNGRPAPNRDILSTSSERMRVSSPDGRLDAVFVLDTYGPPSGGRVDSKVYIVPQGATVNMKAGREVFSADPMTGGQLVWKRNHLLEIHYDIADIHEFRNLWGLYEVQDVGSEGEHDYEVEIQLVPSSNSSVLKPDGSFRSPGYR